MIKFKNFILNYLISLLSQEEKIEKNSKNDIKFNSEGETLVPILGITTDPQEFVDELEKKLLHIALTGFEKKDNIYEIAKAMHTSFSEEEKLFMLVKHFSTESVKLVKEDIKKDLLSSLQSNSSGIMKVSTKDMPEELKEILKKLSTKKPNNNTQNNNL